MRSFKDYFLPTGLVAAGILCFSVVNSAQSGGANRANRDTALTGLATGTTTDTATTDTTNMTVDEAVAGTTSDQSEEFGTAE